MPWSGHHFPQRVAWVPVRSQDGECLLRVKNVSEINGHEGGVPVKNISELAKGAQQLGQGQMTGDTGGILSGTAGTPTPKYVLGPPHYGVPCGKILRQPF